jgi:DNA polymerase delta subunit 1
MGNREREDINTEGRIQLDMLIVMLQNHKLSSYTLNYVCLFFLKE